MKFEYGAMSSRYSLEADNKLTAYAAMVFHFEEKAAWLALYEPYEIVKNDSWLNPFGDTIKRLDEIFGGEGSFNKYVESHVEEIQKAYNSIEQLI